MSSVNNLRRFPINSNFDSTKQITMSTAPKNSRGISRVLSKMEASVEAGEYYEAHQMYRTLYFRYISQKRFDECLDLLYRGALVFLNHDQFSSGADLGLLVVDTLEKYPMMTEYEIWFQRLGILMKKLGPNIIERDTLLVRSIKWSRDVVKCQSGHPMLHKIIAQMYWDEGNLEPARQHFILAKDGLSCGQLLIELSTTKGFSVETDLFLAQIVLQQLSIMETQTANETFTTYTKYHPKIATTEPPFSMPLLNFVYFLLKSIDAGKLTVFKALCDMYKPSLDRDPSYHGYLKKIGTLFFGAAPQSQTSQGGIFGDLINQFFQVLDDDEPPPTDNQSATNTMTSAREADLD